MRKIDRREFALLAAGTSILGGCAAARPPVASTPEIPTGAPAPVPGPATPALAWREDEVGLVSEERPDFDVVVRGCSDTLVLRTRAREVPAGADLDAVEARMRKTMVTAGGVGLAGPQVGLYLRVAVLQLDYKTDNPTTIFVRNPVIVERSDDSIEGYEGCLSIPGVGGKVRRNRWLRIEHTAPDGRVLTAQAEGYNAVLWQHELDHLDGILYVDKLLGELMPMEEVRRLRKEMDAEAAAGDQARLDMLEGASWILPA